MYYWTLLVPSRLLTKLYIYLIVQVLTVYFLALIHLFISKYLSAIYLGTVLGSEDEKKISNAKTYFDGSYILTKWAVWRDKLTNKNTHILSIDVTFLKK